MTEAELLLVKEGLKLAEDGLQQLSQVQNAHISHIASLLKTAIAFGEMMLNSSLSSN